MIRITGIAHHIPAGFESNFDKRQKFNVEDDFITDKLGVHRVSRMDDGDEASDLCVKAFNALPDDARPEHVDCIVVCTQNPDAGGIPHVSAIVHGKLGLDDDCACFDVSLGCSGYVYALSIVQSFMQGNGLDNALLFTADPYSGIVDPDDRNTAMLFGDAATVTVLRSGGAGNAGGWGMDRFIFNTRGRERDVLCRRGEYLSMNGRAVFNFALTEVPVQVDRLLGDAGLSHADVDAFIFHQGSKYIVDQLARRMGLDQGKVPVQLKDTGNTVSSSIPVILERLLDDGSKNTMVLSGFGLGLSWASCIIRREQGVEADV